MLYKAPPVTPIAAKNKKHWSQSFSPHQGRDCLFLVCSVTQGLNDGRSTSCLSPAGPGSLGEGDWIEDATGLGSSARNKCPPQTPGLG